MERHELEEQRQLLLAEVNANNQRILDLQDDLLSRLSNSQGNLLQDDSLVQVLNTTKNTVREVQEKVRIASETQAMLIKAREEYRGVATRGSVLYSVISDCGLINPMYQTSLAQVEHSIAGCYSDICIYL